MECLTDIKIQDYLEGHLTSVENAMVRDHLIVCPHCSKTIETYELLEKSLFKPVEMTPPLVIEQNVMKALFPKLPSYSSIFALIAASFLLLITFVYTYFDFANNSIIQAFNLTTNQTTSWIGSVVRFISTTFTSIYSVFKVVNRLLHVLFDVNLGVTFVVLIVSALLLFLLMFVFKITYKRLVNQR